MDQNSDDHSQQMAGTFFVMDNNNLEGLTSWTSELKDRGMPAVIKISEPLLVNSGDAVKNALGDDFDIIGGFDAENLWDASYDFQLEQMSRIKDEVSACTGKSMRFFCGKFLSYNENTLKAADKLGVEYIFALGTVGARTVVYQTDEYKTKIISVSSILSSAGKRGSLCDHAMLNCGETPEGFKDTLFNIKEDKIILVGWSYLSGLKSEWRNIYREYFDAGLVQWKPIDALNPHTIHVPFSKVIIARKD